MKKIICIVIGMLMLLSVFAACGKEEVQLSATPLGEQPANTAPASQDPDTPAVPQTGNDSPSMGELNIAIFEGGYGPDFWIKVVEMFENDNPGITVNMQISPEIGDIIRPQIVAGNIPDFLNMNVNDQTGVVQNLIQERGLLELTDLFDGPQYDNNETVRSKIIDGFLQSALCAPYGDGRIYLAPSNAGPMGLVYNITLFEDMGWSVPVTWDDFFALGEKAAEQDISLLTYQGIYPGYMESMIFPAIASEIGLDDFAKITSYEPGIWVDPRVVAVLEQFEKIGTSAMLMPGTVALNHTQSQTDQMNNRALFIPNGTWMEPEMEDVPRAVGYRFGLTPPPVMRAGAPRYIMSHFEQFTIPAGAKNPEHAKLFLRFLYTDEVIRLYAQMSGAVMATNNALELTREYLTDGVYGMFGSYSEPGAVALMVGFDALPEGTLINISDEIFQPLADVMTGRMTAREWAESIDQAYVDMAAGR